MEVQASVYNPPTHPRALNKMQAWAEIWVKLQAMGAIGHCQFENGALLNGL